MRKWRKSKLAALSLSFVMALSVGFLSNTDQSSAATTQLTGKNYKFQSSVHSPSFTWSSSEAGGTMKVAYNASCEHGRYEGGWWDVKLQKKVSGTWKTVANTADVGCTTYKQVGTLSFGKVSSSGTYRVLFKRLYNHDNGAAIGYVNIHSFSVYRG